MKVGLYTLEAIIVLSVLFVGYTLAKGALRWNQKRRLRAEPWRPWEGDIDGRWIIQAHRPGHEPLTLADAGPVVADDFSYNIEQAHSDALAKFITLRPRGKWTL